MSHPREPGQIAELRRAKIVAEIQRTGAVTVAGLAEDFDVTPMTIRRDINQLAHAGLIVRVHGGAVAPSIQPATSRGRAWTIGMVTPSHGHYWSKIVAAGQREALRVNCRFAHRTVEQESDYLRQVRRILSDARLDGIVLSPPLDPELAARVEDWARTQAPHAVFVERPVGPALLLVQSVRTDYARGAAAAAQHLWELGHRRVAIVVDAENSVWCDLLGGWQETLARLDLPILPAMPPAGDLDDRRDELNLAMVRALQADKVSAVLVVNDINALALIEAARDAGLVVPRDLSVISYGGELADLGRPMLTAVRPPLEPIGQLAVRVLVDQLRLGSAHAIQHIRVAPVLSVHGTTAAAPPV